MAVNSDISSRTTSSIPARIYEFGPFRLDSGQRILTCGPDQIKLKPKTFELLECLIQRSNEVIDKSWIMHQVWPNAFVEDANLTVHISALRKIFAEHGAPDISIETFPKVGYRLNAEVRLVDSVRSHSAHIDSIATADQDEHNGTTGALQEAVEAGPFVYGRRTRILTAVFVVSVLIFGGGYFLKSWYVSNRAGSPTVIRVPGTEQSSSIALSPNGEYIAHAVSAAGKRTLTMTHINSGSSIQLLPPDEALFHGMTFSRDSSFLYFVKSGAEHTTLYRIPILGGTVTRLLDQVDHRISFSPDGSRFCFVRKLPDKSTAMMIANADGSDVREIARRTAPRFYSGFEVSWSPNGKLIASAAGSGGKNPDIELVGVDVETGEESRLNDRKWAGIDGIEWLGDGSGLVTGMFESPTSPTNVWFVPYPQGEPVKIINDLENYGSIGVSADGSTIMAGHFRDNTSVWVQPGNDPSKAQPVKAGKHHNFAWVRWLSDSAFIFGSNAGDNRDVWRMNLDGAEERMLTNGPQSNVMPVPTGDGRYILFSAFRDDNGLFELWRMGADGEGQTQITPTGGGAWQPSVTPDGKWAFYTSGTMDGPPVQRRIWKVPVEGGEPVLFMDRAAYQPDVSPDGKFVACWLKHDEKAKPQAAVFPLEGGEPVRVFDGPVGNRLDWTPDGKGLSYIVTADGVSNIWTQPIDGGPPRRETNFNAEIIRNFDWSFDGRLLISRYHKTRDVILIRNFR